ncbi:hypothetical protein GO730_31900 [Spirosoma sp. HMF3257]|uniref:Uncharacterized protein n=1 Tax=Spirosoma telluris TaxID=2183553 RepID=A0A327NUC1_9BACT|nr:hypothetical protein [Spirosoma telluris]RAI77596.1 hypothetical protein HMF3257_31795 [Spirosoma telluris]
MTALEKHLITVQQKLEHLNTEVATLIALTASEKTIDTLTDSNANRPAASSAIHSQKSSVGINRYRQLQLNE